MEIQVATLCDYATDYGGIDQPRAYESFSQAEHLGAR